MKESELFPDESKAKTTEVAGADLAGAVTALESRGEVVEMVDVVGQSEYRLHHRPGRKKWRALRGNSLAENGRAVQAAHSNYVSPPSQSLNAYMVAEKFNLNN